MQPGRVAGKVEIARSRKADGPAAGAPVLDLDPIAGLDDLRFQPVELLQRVARAVQAVDRRVERIDALARRHPLQVVGTELQRPRKRTAGGRVVEAAAKVEIAADEPVEPASLVQELAEIRHIERDRSNAGGGLDAKGRASTGTKVEVGRQDTVASHLEPAGQAAQ